jgi:hypothetical protein
MVHSYILANDTPILSEMWVQKNQMSIHAVACNKADIHEDSWSGSGLTLYIYFCNDAMLPSIQISMAASLHTIKQGHSYGMSGTWMISGQIGRKVVCPIRCIYSSFGCLNYHWIDETFSCDFIMCMGTLI